METKQLIEIVAKARQGDSKALQDLYLDMYKSVYCLALRIVKNSEDAEDVTQEVYITVQQKIAELREPAAFYGWVNQITANKCNRILSKYKGIARLDDEDEFIDLVDDDPTNLPDKALDDEATRKIILEVIDNLPDNQRACVILFYYTQNTVTQIADMLETNENTVKSRLALARAKIRAALEHKAEKEGIKLWGIPLALTPILREAMEQFVMPADAEARIVEFVSKATAENAGDSPDTSGQNVPKSGTGGAAGTATNEAIQSIVKAVIAMSTKKIITIAMIVLLSAAVITAGVVFLPKLINLSSTSGNDQGTYEGTYDANGKRSGYGVWIYHNFRYEGYFENDMPNGEGTLYETGIPPKNKEQDHTYTTKSVVRGNWVNGFSNGMITLSWYMDSGETYVWALDTANGYPTKDGTVYAENGLTDLNYTKDWLIGGVPPWADVSTDPKIAPPSGGNSPDDGNVTPGKNDANKPSYTTANIKGNTSGNISNRGLAAIQGDWIYFSSNDGNFEADPANEHPNSAAACGNLYAVKTDGSGLRKLADDRASHINVVGDWVYYYNESPDGPYSHAGLYKVKIDGTERQQVTSYAQSLCVVGDWVYFTNFNLYAINLAANEYIGSVDQYKILDVDINTEGWMQEIAVSGDWVYYTYYKGGGLYKIKNNGTGKQKLTGDNCQGIQIVGDTIYYENYSETGALYVIKTDGTGRRRVIDNARPSYYNVTGNMIYFSNMDDDYKLYSVKPDGSELTKISDECLEYMNVAGDWIYYVNRDDYKMYAIKTDGTGRRLVD